MSELRAILGLYFLCPGCGLLFSWLLWFLLFFACLGLWAFVPWCLCWLCPVCGHLFIVYQVIYVRADALFLSF